MSVTVDYWFTPQSPWTYLGHERFARLLAQSGAGVRVLPVDYGRIFPASGGLPLPKRAPQRQAYRLVELARWSRHLGVPMNVQPRFSRHIARYLGREDRDAWHRQRADQALAAARALLGGAGVPHHLHWAMGDRAREICAAAARLQVHHILMGTARKNSITRMLEDSATHRVLEATTVPVELVTGEAVSRLERWGLPASVLGVGGGLLWLALAD